MVSSFLILILLGGMSDWCGIVVAVAAVVMIKASSLFDLAAPTLDVMVSKDWVP